MWCFLFDHSYKARYSSDGESKIYEGDVCTSCGSVTNKDLFKLPQLPLWETTITTEIQTPKSEDQEE